MLLGLGLLEMLHELDCLLHGISYEYGTIENHLRHRHRCGCSFFPLRSTARKIEEGGLVRRWWTVRDEVLLMLPYIHRRSEGLTGWLLPGRRGSGNGSSSMRWWWRRRWEAVMRLFHLWEFRQTRSVEPHLGVVERTLGWP